MYTSLSREPEAVSLERLTYTYVRLCRLTLLAYGAAVTL
jgi:hypothetical protein